MLASIAHCTTRSVLRALIMEGYSLRPVGGLQRFYGGIRLRKTFFLLLMMTMVCPSGPHAQKNLERDGMVAIGRIQRRRLVIKCHICAQPQLPGAVVNQVALAAERVRPDPVDRMHWRLGKEFVLI